MSHQTANTNFIRLLPVEPQRSAKVSPPTNKTSQHRCASCMQREAASSEPQDWKPTQHIPDPEREDHRNDDIPSLNIAGLYPQLNQHPTTKTNEETHLVKSAAIGERLAPGPWSVPHASENQKHAWYSSMLGIEAKVKDEWGFSSASASRSHTPSKMF